ncbi:uncharacterized protein UTRI_05756 [Ustilago trichophora]|uniref:Uncharacterized protein n=1 Tax=Ustilago trichophora TaxID=86804 RepID=A0A5C3EIP1_9BASI|nr:uncharacterized protein UTRI_05756 [Ustilago trichophora]
MSAKTVGAADVRSTDTKAVPSSVHGNRIAHHRGNVTTLSWRQREARPHHHQSLRSHNLGYLQAQVKLQLQAQARLVVKPKANLAHAQDKLEQFPLSLCQSSAEGNDLLLSGPILDCWGDTSPTDGAKSL